LELKKQRKEKTMSKLTALLAFAAVTMLLSPSLKAQSSSTSVCASFIKLDWMETIQHFERGGLCYILKSDDSSTDFAAALTYDSMTRSAEMNPDGNRVAILKRSSMRAVVLARFEKFSEFGETLKETDEMDDDSMSMRSK
jgi:hypothetical protein